VRKVRIRILGGADGEPTEFDGQYVKEYDPRRWGDSPSGEPMFCHLVTTTDPAQAIAFDNLGDALKFWRWAYGMRPDGEPMRPLTHFNVEFA